jgi:alkylhydroperoxidase/carboxymuconolactone decarboxylase family protein YurZ
MRVLLIACLTLFSAPILLHPAQVLAQTQAEADPAATMARIVQAMQIAPMLEVMQEEGIAYGEDLATDMLGGQSDRWSAIVAEIYDARAMEATFTARFTEELAADATILAAIEGFFASDRGQRIVTLEVEARRAMLDEAVEDAATVLMQDMVAAEDPRFEMLRTFVAAGDLEEQNVVGAMNANFAFMQGMASAGGPAAQMTEEDMLADVWGREGEVRASTREWLYSYFALAYQPLDDADLAAYTAFWESDAGRKTNAALFAAFDTVFVGISRDLGQAAAIQMQGDDI